MGVSGCGKSSVGAAFTARIGADFVDGDDLHPQSNIAKMAKGIPLDDKDRAPWLAIVGQSFKDSARPLGIACSALKRHYRDTIRENAGGPVTFVHLHGIQEMIAQRMAARADHFMPTGLLDSQFATLEALGDDEQGVVVDVTQNLEDIVAALVTRIGVETQT